MTTHDHVPVLFTFNGTPVRARRGFWMLVAFLWVMMALLASWRRAESSLPVVVLLGGAGVLLALLADIGHACAHTFGAKMANAPTHTILLGMDLPRTLYPPGRVAPRAHILRALGGPAYSLIGLLTGVGWLLLTEPGTAIRFLAEVWLVTNGFIFSAAFAPLSILDGGVIMKWLLVMRGWREDRADRLLKRASLGLGAVMVLSAAAAALSSLPVIGGVLAVVGIFIILAAAGIIQ